jgi:hypothetical protein
MILKGSDLSPLLEHIRIEIVRNRGVTMERK